LSGLQACRAPGVTKLFIEPGSRWASGCLESPNGRTRDELPDRAPVWTLAERGGPDPGLATRRQHDLTAEYAGIPPRPRPR